MKRESSIARETLGRNPRLDIHPSWLALIRYCQNFEFGELERMKIQL